MDTRKRKLPSTLPFDTPIDPKDCLGEYKALYTILFCSRKTGLIPTHFLHHYDNDPVSSITFRD